MTPAQAVQEGVAGGELVEEERGRCCCCGRGGGGVEDDGGGGGGGSDVDELGDNCIESLPPGFSSPLLSPSPREVLGTGSGIRAIIKKN